MFHFQEYKNPKVFLYRILYDSEIPLSNGKQRKVSLHFYHMHIIIYTTVGCIEREETERRIEKRKRDFNNINPKRTCEGSDLKLKA